MGIRKIAVLATAVLVAASVGACGAGSSDISRTADVRAMPSTFTLTGVLGLKVGDYSGTGPCTGRDDHTDIHAGTEVTVTDPSGITLATGQLSAGAIDRTTTDCQLPISVAGVPVGYTSYAVVVAHRAPRAFRAEVAQGGHLLLNLK